ncbi:MAG: capsular polysaccharide biosynthesis protein [archaeon GW2011_AR19]|nr:MAG: capsular polysaccharide biosynthesis protein [archaeon GW2011_AR19]
MIFEKIKKNELFRGSLILFVLINIGNLINYLYQIIMARMLGPSDYGILAVLISFTYIFTIPTLAIQTAVSKKIAIFNATKEYNKMGGLFFSFLKKLFIFSLIVFILFVILSFFIIKPLNISFWLLVLTGTLIIASFVYPLAAGSLQGMKKFSALGWNTLLVFFIKIVVAIILVIFGFKVYGAILGFILGMVFGFILALPYIKEIINAKRDNDGTKILTKENSLIFGSILVFVFIYSIDVILARVFFSSEIAGQYAVLSTIGKMILFSTMSIGNAMFPISAERHYAKAKTSGIIKKASLYVFILCAAAVALFIILPELTIKLLFGSQYLEIAELLPYLGIAFSLIAFLNILILYRISTDEFNLPHLLLIILFLVIEIILLFLFNADIKQFTLAFMFSTIITFIGAFIFVRKWKKSA